MWKLYVTCLLLASASVLFAQTFNGTGGLIPNNGSPASFSIQVSGLSPQTIDTLRGLETVGIDIIHPWVEELKIEVIAPDGNVILLTESLGGDGNNFTQTFFRDDSEVSIYNGIPPYTGNYRPLENVGYLNNGQVGNGTWQLRIRDQAPGGSGGSLLAWTLKFGNNPGFPFPFDSSILPIVMIDTRGAVIPDDPKIMAGMKIIDNGEGNFNRPDDPPAYDYYCGIEVRGSSSQMFLKKSYGFETWDSLQNSVDTILLGMPKESDWILNANFSDKTLLRNTLAYQNWMDLGHYATRYRHVELFLNERYKGIYIFSEKIKRDNDRVDIAKLTPDMNSGDSLTGGYIFKIDKGTGTGGDGWMSRYDPPVHPIGQYIWFQYEYPKYNLITPQQKLYIQDYVDQFETALAGPAFSDTAEGFRHYAVEETFYDYFIVNEFSKNVDGYRLSTFVHKERDSKGGKVRMGPVWDYDLAWHNADYCAGDTWDGWAYQFPCDYDWWQIPFWWGRLLEDTLYANNLQCRWQEVRSSFLSDDAVFAWVDSMAVVLNEAQVRNFTVWPILGVYVWPNPYPYPQTYDAEIQSMKSWMYHRLQWLDEHMPGYCWVTASPHLAGDRPVRLYPNPATEVIHVEGYPPQDGPADVEIFSIVGQRVLTRKGIPGPISVNIRQLPAGSYVVKISSRSVSSTTTFIKL